MSRFTSVLIGDESLLIECAKLLIQRGHGIQAVATRNDDVALWATGAGIAVVEPGAGLEMRLTVGFDWLLSIANLTVLPRAVLDLARKGAVNFHDGPLPRYAGLNAPVWAMLNGETQHGITWHLIGSDVDAGDIVEQRLFEILPDDTALSLNARAYATAIESFPAVIDALETDVPGRSVQDLSQRTLCRRDDRPRGFGRLDFTQAASEVARLVRAMDHGGYWNPLSLPKLETAKGVFGVSGAEVVAGSGAPGVVLAVDDGLTVACSQGAVRLTGITCLGGLPVQGVAAVGDALVMRDLEMVDMAMRRIVGGEGAWRKTLTGFSAAEPVFVGGETGEISCDLGMDGLTAAAALSVLGARIWDGCGMALAVPSMPDLPEIMSWLPMQADGDDLAMVVAQVRATLARAERNPGVARDLIARDPALMPIPVPALGWSLDKPIDGTALCIVGDTKAKLVADGARVSKRELELIAERLALIASADPDTLVADLPILPQTERDYLLETLNQTQEDYDRNATLQTLFETQVAKTPDATALVFEGQSLTYADLNARANRAAHVLREMGVGPDVPVGLCLRRSPEMLVAALAILKAGGAYVPMDPAYPADRLAHFLTDSVAPVLITQRDLIDSLPAHSAQMLVIDTDTRLAGAPDTNPMPSAGPENLAYLIYTSGSTGKPKGVMVEHRNVANFFTGMDARIDDHGGVWLAVTSLSFDISVLELFWTLARGFKVVLTSDEDRVLVSGGAVSVSDKPMEFSLFYWGNDDGPGPRKYELLLEGAKFADTHGFTAVWTPERHFHAFGGPYPNPSVTGAAVAAVTKNISVRSGSVVAPLHHPLRIAEEWAVIDNLTNGRAGLGIASGWHPVDFVLRPENCPPNNKTAMFDTIDKVRRLWRGEEVAFDRGTGEMVPVQSLPRPVSRELELWLTIAGNPDTWREAGEIGAHVLTHLLGQSIDEVAEKIKIYHDALRKAGHDPRDFKVTLMLHTFVARDRELARETARKPMRDYLLAAAGLVKQYAWSFPAFKRPQGATSPMDIDLRTLSQDEVDGILDYAFNRYFEDSGLFGTVEDCLRRVEHLKSIGVTEVACLIDYGIATQQVLEGLYPLAEVVKLANQPSELAADDFSIAAQIKRHGVTHLQCTPSMARMIAIDDTARAELSGVRHLMLGGEALPGALAADLSSLTGAPVQNMYGPTETTIWSTTTMSHGGEGVVGIGSAIANTSLYVLDDMLNPVPVGATGELWIGGEGVARGYWQRDDLTTERFVPNPFASGRMYRTGDLVRWRADGGIDFLGRADHQVKIRGYRIELGEIESVIDALPGVTQSVVIPREDTPGDVRLVAYVIGTAQDSAMRAAVASELPAHMRPAHFVTMDSFPLTPNKKIDRKALPAPGMVTRTAAEVTVLPGSDTQTRIMAIWRGILGVQDIKPSDHFFQLGGHSLLAVQAHREMREKLSLPSLSITDVFRFPVLSQLAAHIDARMKPAAAPETVQDTGETAQSRLDAMSKRRMMRAERLNRAG